MLRLRQFAFPHNALVLLACTLDAIFELPPIVRKLLGHNVGPARHIATDCAPDVHGLSNLEFVRRHRTSHVCRRADELRGQCHLGDSPRGLFLLAFELLDKYSKTRGMGATRDPRIHAPTSHRYQRRQMINASNSIMPSPITSTANATES